MYKHTQAEGHCGKHTWGKTYYTCSPAVSQAVARSRVSQYYLYLFLFRHGCKVLYNVCEFVNVYVSD